MEPYDSFGEWLRQRRRALDLTRDRLAQCVSFSVSGLRKIEDGERRPSRQTAELLAQCLQIPPHKQAVFLQVARGVECVERLGEPGLHSEAAEPGPRWHHTPSNLPTPSTPMIGREPELAALAGRLGDPRCRLLTLIGPGGIGKTRLAIEAASAQRTAFADGVFFVSLASAGSAECIVPAIAGAIGLSFAGPLSPRTQLIHSLRDKRMLLVLDSVEHLLEGAGFFGELLGGAPNVKLLVSSCMRLNLQGEWVVEIQGLPVPATDQVEHAEGYSSVALFITSARRAQADFELRAKERPAVVRICQMVEGMPLGIELAAAWVPVLTCTEIMHEMERSLDFLSTSCPDAPERQRSLRAAFDHSWSRLSKDERQVLSRLATFQGDFERQAAEQVAGATLPALSALISKSLVHRKANGCYDLHPVVRQYALSHLADGEQSEAPGAAPGIAAWVPQLDREAASS